MQNIASAVEGLINMIPGVTVDLTSGLGGWITDLAKKRSDEIQNSGYYRVCEAVGEHGSRKRLHQRI